MQSSVGQDTLKDRIDQDQDGVADQAEQDFAEFSQAQPTPGDANTDPAPARTAARREPSADDDTDLRPVLPDGETGKPIEAPISAN